MQNLKTGPELMEEIARYPTLDILMDRNPYAVPLTKEEMKLQIARMRAERALFQIKEQERKDKKDERED